MCELCEMGCEGCVCASLLLCVTQLEGEGVEDCKSRKAIHP